MDEEKPRSLRSRFLIGFATVLGLCLLYVLSIGPVEMILILTRSKNPNAMKIYTPLALAANANTWSAIEVYVSWWDALAYSIRPLEKVDDPPAPP